MNWERALELYSALITGGLIFMGVRARRVDQLIIPEQPEGNLRERFLPLLIQYQTVLKTIEAYPDTPASKLIGLLRLLDTLIPYWNLEPIGIPWEVTIYDPQLHQADSPEIKLGETVYVRFVGYRSGKNIYAPAKVSRKLPSE